MSICRVIMDNFDNALCKEFISKKDPSPYCHVNQHSSGSESQVKLTDDECHPKRVFAESVVVDDVTHLGKCNLTGDWRFFTASPGHSRAVNEVKCMSAGTRKFTPVKLESETADKFNFLFQAQSNSADPRSSARRRRYGSLKLEDMGIKPTSDMPLPSTSDFGVILVDGSKEVLFPAATIQSSTKASSVNLLDCSLLQMLGPARSSLEKKQNVSNVSNFRYPVGNELQDSTCTSEVAAVASNRVGPSLGGHSSVGQNSTLVNDSTMTFESSKNDLLPLNNLESQNFRTNLNFSSQENSYFSYPLNEHSDFLSEQCHTIQFDTENIVKISCQTDDCATLAKSKGINCREDVFQNCNGESEDSSFNLTTVEIGNLGDVADHSRVDIYDMESDKAFKKNCHLILDTVQNLDSFSGADFVVCCNAEPKTNTDIAPNENDLFKDFRCKNLINISQSSSALNEAFAYVLDNDCIRENSKTSSGVENINCLDKNFSNSDDFSLRTIPSFDGMSANIKSISESDKYHGVKKHAGVKVDTSVHEGRDPALSCSSHEIEGSAEVCDVLIGKCDSDMYNAETGGCPAFEDKSKNLIDKIPTNSLEVSEWLLFPDYQHAPVDISRGVSAASNTSVLNSGVLSCTTSTMFINDSNGKMKDSFNFLSDDVIESVALKASSIYDVNAGEISAVVTQSQEIWGDMNRPADMTCNVEKSSGHSTTAVSSTEIKADGQKFCKDLYFKGTFSNVAETFTNISNLVSDLSFPELDNAAIQGNLSGLLEAVCGDAVNDGKVEYPDSSCSGLIVEYNSSSPSLLLQSTTEDLGILCPSEQITDKLVSPDSYDNRDNVNVSLLSWLQKNGSRNPLASAIKPRISPGPPSSLIPVITHRRRSSLPDNCQLTLGNKKQSVMDDGLASSVQQNSENSVLSAGIYLPLLMSGTASGGDIIGSFHKGDYIYSILSCFH